MSGDRWRCHDEKRRELVELEAEALVHWAAVENLDPDDYTTDAFARCQVREAWVKAAYRAEATREILMAEAIFLVDDGVTDDPH